MNIQRLNSELNSLLDKDNNFDNVLLYSDKEGIHFKEKTLFWKVGEFIKKLFGVDRSSAYELSANLEKLQPLSYDSVEVSRLYNHLRKKINPKIHVFYNNNRIEDFIKKYPTLNLVNSEISDVKNNEKILLLYSFPDCPTTDLNMIGRGLNINDQNNSPQKFKHLPNQDRVFIGFIREKPFTEAAGDNKVAWSNLLYHHHAMVFESKWETNVFVTDGEIDQKILEQLNPPLTERSLARDSLIKQTALNIFHRFI